MGGVINYRHRQADAQDVSSCGRNTGRGRRPKVDFRRGERLAQGRSGGRREACFDTDGYPTVVDVNPAGGRRTRPGSTNNASVNFKNFSVKLDYDPERPPACLRGAPVTSARSAYNGQDQHVSRPFTEERQRQPAGTTRAAAIQDAPGRTRAPSRRRCSSTTRPSTATSSLYRRPRPPRQQHRSDDASTRGSPRDRGRRHGPVVAAVRRAANSVSVGADYRWVDGRQRRGTRLDAVTGSTVHAAPRLWRHAAQTSARLCRTSSAPARNLTVTLSATCGRLAQLRRPQHGKTTLATGAGERSGDRGFANDNRWQPRASALTTASRIASVVWGDFRYRASGAPHAE